MFRMPNRLSYLTLALLLLAAPASAQTNATAKAGNAPAVSAPVESDRSRDGLIGPVRRVRTEVAKLVNTDGKQAEAKHTLVELASYDIKGNKTENQYFPMAGATLTGKEVYKYDEKGNISEMTLLNPDGSLLSKETYKYEFDFLGNWNKMTTPVAVVDSRGITFEPTEVTYRSIMYYLYETRVKMVTPGATTNSAATNPQPTAPVAAAPAPVSKPESKTTGRNNKKAPVVQELPSASTSAAKLASGPVDVKVQNVSTNQPLPIVMLDEPPPSP